MRLYRRAAAKAEYALLLLAVLIAAGAAVRKVGPRVAQAATSATGALEGGGAGGGGGTTAGGARLVEPAAAPPLRAAVVVGTGSGAGSGAGAGAGAGGAGRLDPLAQFRADRETVRQATLDSAQGKPLTDEQREAARRLTQIRILDKGAAQVSASIEVQKAVEAKGTFKGVEIGTQATVSTKVEAGLSTKEGGTVESVNTVESQNRIGVAGVTAYSGKFAETSQGLGGGNAQVATGSRVGVEVKRDFKLASVAGYGEIQEKSGEVSGVLGVKASRPLGNGREVTASAEVKVRPPRGSGFDAELARRLLHQDERVRMHHRYGGTGFPPGVIAVRP